MSESPINASATQVPPAESFSANIVAHGASVHVYATSLDAMLKTLAQFGYPVPNLDAAVQKVIEKVAEATKPTPKKEAAVQTGKPAPAAVAAPSPSTTSAAASAPSSPDSAVTPTGDDTPRPTYDDVKKAVLAMAKVDQNTAIATLKKFKGQNGEPCDHGTKLKLEDYPAFLAAAKEALEGVPA